MQLKPIAIYHEHPDWFRPLFAELDRRDIPYVRLDASSHLYDPSDTSTPYSLVFNRASPSAHLRGNGQSTFFTQGWLKHLERIGVPVVNGSRPYEMETSKALQLDILSELGLPYPRTRVVNSTEQVVSAAADLRFPVLVKANIGGSGAGISSYDNMDGLRAAAGASEFDFGVDGTALVQERAPLRGGHITRIETLGGRFLYAIDVYPAVGSFDLCPADVCQTTGGESLVRGACAVDAPTNKMTVSAANPSMEIVAQVEQIARRTGLDVGGVELLIDDRDGQHYFYDVNALSNFVADALRVVGFDPFVALVDYLAERAGITASSAAMAGAA